MPISYLLDRERQLIRTTCAGPVSLDEVRAHFETLAAEPDLPGRLDVLLDLRPTTSLPDGDEMHAVAGAVALLRSRLVWGACAVIASSDALFGMSRVFEVRTGPLFERVAVFRELTTAGAWLAEPTKPVA